MHCCLRHTLPVHSQETETLPNILSIFSLKHSSQANESSYLEGYPSILLGKGPKPQLACISLVPLHLCPLTCNNPLHRIPCPGIHAVLLEQKSHSL